MRSEKNSSGKRRAYKGKFRERFISRCQGSIVPRRAEASKKKALCIQGRSVRSATRVHHFQFRPFNFSLCGSLLFFSLFVRSSIQSRSFSCVSHSRHIRSIALYVRRHLIAYAKGAQSIKSILSRTGSRLLFSFWQHSDTPFVLVLARLIVFQKSHTDDDCDILV